MSLQDWAAFAEIVGAIAVVLTLLYLAIQVRQNTKAIQSTNAMTVHTNIQDLAKGPTDDRELGDIILRALDGSKELKPEEKLAAYAWFFIMLKTGELAHIQYRNGELDEQYWEASLVFFRAYWQTPGFKLYWADRKGAFTPSFRSAVEEWLDGSSIPVTRADILYSESVTTGSQ